MVTMKNVVIVGAGHGAGQAVAALRQQQYAGTITLIGDEPWLPYQRPPLSKKYLAGELPAERLYFKPASFYDDAAIRLMLNTRVSSIDRDTRSVTTATGDTIGYDELLIATGSRPRTLALPGVDLDGVHYLRSIRDVDEIRAGMQAGKRLTIVGAGYIGLEVAAVATTLGMQVTVIEMADRVMSRVVSPELSAFYASVHSRHGVNFRFSAGLKGFTGTSHVQQVELASGEVIPADSVVIGVGIVPNVELAEAAGIETSDGVVVDDHCRTSDPHIYAIGDCSMHPNTLLGVQLRLESVHNALEQAKTAAANICGEEAVYCQVPWFWSDQYDLKLQIAGISQGYDQVVIRGSMEERAFACLYLRDGQLIAVDAVNRPKEFVQSKALIAAHARIAPAMLADSSIELREMS